MGWLLISVGALLGYLLGSVPVGVLATAMYGVDIRKVGSGRTGGTNAWRAAGLKAAVPTVLGDALKGAAGVLLIRSLAGVYFPQVDEISVAIAASLAGATAVLGHNWSVFLGFKGGGRRDHDSSDGRGTFTADRRYRLSGRRSSDRVEPHGLYRYLQCQCDNVGLCHYFRYQRPDSLALYPLWPHRLSSRYPIPQPQPPGTQRWPGAGYYPLVRSNKACPTDVKSRPAFLRYMGASLEA